MSTKTITDVVVLETLECGECHIKFAIPQTMYASRREDGLQFYCPNGHHVCYCDSKLKIAERALQMERAAHDQTKAIARDLQETAAKLERRLKHGVCPCCRRTFQNLQNHMKTKHPNFGPPALNMPRGRTKGVAK